jgi:hypothetical protein
LIFTFKKAAKIFVDGLLLFFYVFFSVAYYRAESPWKRFF